MASALEQALAAAAVIDLELERTTGLPDLRAYARFRSKIVRTPNLMTLLHVSASAYLGPSASSTSHEERSNGASRAPLQTACCELPSCVAWAA